MGTEPEGMPPLDAGATEQGGLPPLDAGASSDDGLPPLDAGDTDKYPPKPEKAQSVIEEQPEKAEKTQKEEEAEETTEKENPEETDDEVLNLITGESKEVQVPPEGVSKEEWDAFQKFKQEQQSPPTEQVQAPEAVPPDALELTEDEFSAAFETSDGFKTALGKAMARPLHEMRNLVHGDMRQAFTDFGANVTAQIEQMLYLHDAVKESPEILNYPDAFRVAYAKAFKNRKEGDLKGPVLEAVSVLKREMARAEQIKSTKKVDVRGKQQAPKGPTSSSREVHKSAKQGEDDTSGLGFLSRLYA